LSVARGGVLAGPFELLHAAALARIARA